MRRILLSRRSANLLTQTVRFSKWLQPPRNTMTTTMRSLSAATTSTDEAEALLPPAPRTTSLGLNPYLVQPYMESITQLPEVAAVLGNKKKQQSPHNTLESLHRASDIFASFNAGGPEHVAVLALQAEVQQTQLADYQGAKATVARMQTYVNDDDDDDETKSQALALALTKTLWMQGDFEACVQQTGVLQQKLVTGTKDPLWMAAVDCSHVLGTLFHQGPAAAHKAAALTVDMVGLPAQAQAVQCLNVGVVEALWGLGHDCQGDNTCATQLEIAKQTWEQGLTALHESADDTEHYNVSLRYALEGRLQSNLAFAVLEMAGRQEAQISKASEHAGESLRAFEHIHSQENNPNLPDEGWTRALSLVAQCYHRAGHAVTAEGLLQTALDETRALNSSLDSMSPPSLLERQVAYRTYAALCKDWEKRQGDADRFMAQSRALTEKLPGEWKQATELYSSLWFWTPGLFQK